MGKKYNIIGVMSGTSLDGVDLAFCTFEATTNGIACDPGACETILYPQVWQQQLQQLPAASALELAATHVEYGKYLGELVGAFVQRHSLKPDLVASHGHTIFHQPERGFTCQIGDGAALAAASGLKVVCDFRSGDVAAGGQGAPLVPIGDELLFLEFKYCLNLGGFANISMREAGKRIAFDICPANIVLNHLAALKGLPFDENGKLAESGKVELDLLEELNSLDFYMRKPPKSLGREWVEKEVLPRIGSYQIPVQDAARTYCEHIAIQIGKVTGKNQSGSMLVTGGGAFNGFLISRIQANTPVRIEIPDNKIVNFKEAIIFALLGMLRIEEKSNCLASVTGADRDICGGAVYLP